MLEQQKRDLRMPPRYGEDERCKAPFHLQIDLGAVPQQRSHHIQVPMLCRQGEGGASTPVSFVRTESIA